MAELTEIITDEQFTGNVINPGKWELLQILKDRT
jgi:hypothetical protein